VVKVLVGLSRDRIPVASVTGIFFLVDTDRTMCPGVNSASKNEYQGFPWGERRPVCEAHDLPAL